MKKLLSIFLITLTFQTFSQEKSISGSVKEETGIPLLGVTVLIKGITSTTTIFDNWQELTFDFSRQTLTADTSYPLWFDQPDTDSDATGNEYYIDTLQGPKGHVLGTTTFNTAKDNADNYGGGWNSGDNNGTGFGT